MYANLTTGLERGAGARSTPSNCSRSKNPVRALSFCSIGMCGFSHQLAVLDRQGEHPLQDRQLAVDLAVRDLRVALGAQSCAVGAVLSGHVFERTIPCPAWRFATYARTSAVVIVVMRRPPNTGARCSLIRRFHLLEGPFRPFTPYPFSTSSAASSNR